MHPEDLQVNISMKKVQPSIHRINLHRLSGTTISNLDPNPSTPDSQMVMLLTESISFAIKRPIPVFFPWP